MTSEAETPTLSYLADHLRARGFDVRPAPPGQAVPTVLVRLSPETPDSARGLFLELSFLPGLDAQLDDVCLLQCFLPILGKVHPAYHPPLLRLIAGLNSQLPLTGFGFLEQANLLHLKHNLLIPERDTAAAGALVLEACHLIRYLTASFADPLIQVASGRKTLKDAVADTPFAHLFP